MGSAPSCACRSPGARDGVTVTKTFVFQRGSYAIGLDYEVHNDGSAPWEVRPYAQILRNDPRTKRSYFNVDSYAFHGPAIYDGTKYRQLDPTSRDDSHLVARGARRLARRAAAPLRERHRAAARRAVALHAGVGGRPVPARRDGPAQTVAPGASAQFAATLFVGPKLQAQLDATAPELDRVADYGRLWFLAQPLFWLLAQGARAHRQLGCGHHPASPSS